MSCFLFVGPTLYGRAGGPLSVPPEVEVLPPAGRGDIARLTSAHPPGTMILVDGRFHQGLSVGHAELREALEAGWQIWGLSSMGAIRAYEMRLLGMRGFGQVYACFEREEDFQDDEVSLLHAPDPPYRAFSEPLVHLRAALEDWQQHGWLSPSEHADILARLKALWYGDRTLERFAEMTLPLLYPDAQIGANARLQHFETYRLKTHDLAQFLQQQPWTRVQATP